MPRGRGTALTIRLTADERQTLLMWQRSTTIPASQARRGRLALLRAEGMTITAHCRHRRDHPALCLQVGAAISGGGPRRAD